MTFDIDAIRNRFPGLKRPAIFFDNPAGTQISQTALDRMNEYLVNTNANHDGVFATSRESDVAVERARQATAAFLNAARPEEIVFGANMTSLTLHLSRSIAQRLSPGDRLVVTRLDHDANIAPWTLIAAERGVEVDWVDFDIETGTLNLESLDEALNRKPKLVAVGYASNALGTINPVKQIIEKAHQTGAWVFVDAVQYAPHGPIDVQDLDVEFLACSAYKFYGPHVGILYGKYELLDELKAYKVRPASNEPPEKWQTGTANFEGIAGVHGALQHIAWIGEQYGQEHQAGLLSKYHADALKLKTGMAAIREHEYHISQAMMQMLSQIPHLRIYGLDDVHRVKERVPTFAINLEGIHPKEVAKQLDQRNIYVWDGNYYALAVTERLGVEESGGMVRIGAAHYNTLGEVEKLGHALKEIVGA